MTTYTNSFYNPANRQSKQQFITNVAPLKYKGYQIFKHTRIEHHIVLAGVCVGMCTTIEGCKARIDGGTYTTPLNLKK